MPGAHHGGAGADGGDDARTDSGGTKTEECNIGSVCTGNKAIYYTLLLFLLAIDV